MRRNRPSFRISREAAFGLAAAVVIAAIVFAVMLPEIHRRADDKRARRSMSEMREIGTAVEAYAIDHRVFPGSPESAVPSRSLPVRKGYPPGGGAFIAWPTDSRQRIDAVRAALSPEYSARLPIRDPWGNPYLYVTSTDRRKYTILSLGPDGKLGAGIVGQSRFGETDYDLVYADGTFVEWMEGT